MVGSNKVLVFSRYQDHFEACLYALEQENPEVNEFEEAVSQATEIWSFRFSCEYYGSEISRLYFDGINYCQIIVMHDGIFSLTIPALQADNATLTKVSDFDFPQRRTEARLYGLGFNKGYCRVGKKLYRFGYSLVLMGGSYESVVPFDSDSRLGYVLQSVDTYPAFDEELGRLVSISQGHLILHDFSLPLCSLADVSLDLDRSKDAGAWSCARSSLYTT
ncbi:hypothetical protein AGABI1DRAFT_132785 [Agaricus bisporus var. burnettii JB137-S8]|uniref:Uncharacterized protein n=1 Tax=Agaricus bisporus var. burnettii (strain JB137-S8 / ATCC MYA-4627 / FGSC 10392) TaxID=597362 RepID=K5WWB7_AGABU|nr:uncharacterized protein AGABI1DRAFT_132785 [Agaricus bisporus var. burnettii JB137-S8]EKM74877.1 hypothetical protein AGABI1DRAFT_132785 [Agaricus bisporus var. burnettii JB137-S8]